MAVIRARGAGRAALLAVALLAAACAAGPETRALRSYDRSVELAQTPFFPQERYQCGPAALATVLAASGVEVRPEALVDEIYVPEREGSLQAEMIAAARRHGRVPVRLAPQVEAVLAELQAGHPVLVFQNLGLRRMPVWHYAVVVGYDADEAAFILRSGTRRRSIEPSRDWLARWDRAGRWTVVTVPPDAPPASATAEAWLQAVAPFESLGAQDVVLTAYEAALRRWPQSAPVWAAMGNARYAAGDRLAAARAYAQSLTLDGGAVLVRNNYAQALAELGCRARAQDELRRALDQADPAQRVILEHTGVDIAALADSPTPCPL